MGKIISLVISVIYLIVLGIYVGFPLALLYMLPFILPLSCIWSGDSWGKYKGRLGRGYITSESPAFLVRFVGWILLFVMMAGGIIAIGF
ncbi:hypothetical protein ACFL38_04985 [Candidatus Omnitrophota bacterium]